MHQPEHTPRTLFVDDESINQQIGAEILLALGAEADTADNGLQALRLIRTRHYAIVFTDVEMPVMDGATLTHILRSDSRYGELPIIACTAISSPEEEEALLQKGFTAVLRKPFDVQAMQTALNRHATLSGEAPAPSPKPRPRVEAGHAIREELEHLPGFSVRQGLDRVMGNLPLYVSLLFDFRRELAEADKDGRLVVLPVRPVLTQSCASMLYIVDDDEIYEDSLYEAVVGMSSSGRTNVIYTTLSDQMIFGQEAIGKTVFLSREEAEKALQEMEDKKDG